MDPGGHIAPQSGLGQLATSRSGSWPRPAGDMAGDGDAGGAGFALSRALRLGPAAIWSPAHSESERSF